MVVVTGFRGTEQNWTAAVGVRLGGWGGGGGGKRLTLRVGYCTRYRTRVPGYTLTTMMVQKTEPPYPVYYCTGYTIRVYSIFTVYKSSCTKKNKNKVHKK